MRDIFTTLRKTKCTKVLEDFGDQITRIYQNRSEPKQRKVFGPITDADRGEGWDVWCAEDKEETDLEDDKKNNI